MSCAEPNSAEAFHIHMIHRGRITLCTLALALTITGAVAQAQVSTGTKEDETPIRRRIVSPGVAAALAAGMPKYDPPKPVEKKPVSEEVDMRDIDKPRNQIIRLPAYIVREAKPPVFRERDIYSTKGLGELAKNRYLSETAQALNRYTIPLFGIGAEAYALMRYKEDERLKNIADLNESADDIDLVDPENAREIRQATRDTYLRGFNYTYRKKE